MLPHVPVTQPTSAMTTALEETTSLTITAEETTDLIPINVSINVPINEPWSDSNTDTFFDAGAPIGHEWALPFDLAQFNPSLNGVIGNCSQKFTNAIQGMGQSSASTTLVPWAPSTMPPQYRRVLNGHTLADFVAFRRAEGTTTLLFMYVHNTDSWLEKYLKWAAKLGVIDENDTYVPTIMVTHNPERETITLTGFSECTVDDAADDLQYLLNDFSHELGWRYLESSQRVIRPESSKSRPDLSESAIVQGNVDIESTKIFPIRPKDYRPLVQTWIRDIMPFLPKILRPSVGRTYTANLVRRGRQKLDAMPCIQIESPTIPGSKAQEIIKSAIYDALKGVNSRELDIRFVKGSVKRLSGEMTKSDEDAEKDAESERLRRLRHNFTRPYSEHLIGESLGLQCSKTIVATLGGYVSVNGLKHMLTSEHFITESQKSENVDEMEKDLETLISPSRFDLLWMEDDLKQTKRDWIIEITDWAKDNFAGQEICLDDYNNPLIPIEYCESGKRIDKLLEQVKKPLDEYAVGSVFRRSPEPIRVANMPRSLVDVSRSNENQVEIPYHMDWCLCKLRSQDNVNRHRYRSNADAILDDYPKTADLAIQPGDICYETCEVEAGLKVYYVGQGSKHRIGEVCIPSQVSRNSMVTHDWGIMSSDGQEWPYEHVAGDSGAWVIRQNGNKLMGQIHSYSCNQVLFTPINDIFADIAETCGANIELPPCTPEPGQVAMPISASPIFAKPETPPVQSLKYLIPPRAAVKVPPLSRLIEMAPSETQSPKTLEETTGLSDDLNDHYESILNSAVTSSSSTPTICNSPQNSMALELHGTSALSNSTTAASAPRKEIGRVAPEFPIQALNERQIRSSKWLPDGSQRKVRVILRINLNRRASTWPPDQKSNVRTWSKRFFELALSSTSPRYQVPRVARSLSAKASYTIRKNGMSDSSVKPLVDNRGLTCVAEHIHDAGISSKAAFNTSSALEKASILPSSKSPLWEYIRKRQQQSDLRRESLSRERLMEVD